MAAAELARLLPIGSRIQIKTSKGDRYGRFIAEITTSTGINVSDAMLASTMAKVYA